ncbi:MAG TPA: hypothetical protein VMY39_01030, partial [Planctomycetota bacterium]|nr:hypothetical protein [Planctomycetota bacterium]
MIPVDATAPGRVLFVNHTGRVSGAELSLLGLVAKLDRKRFTPMVACPRAARLTGSPLTGSPSSGRDLAARLRTLGVPHLPLRIRRVVRTRSLAASVLDLVNLAAASLALAALVVKHRIDLVHANSTAAHLAAG